MEIAKSIAPIALAIIMFGLGLGLTVEDFKRIIKIPRNFFVGFLCQVILLPIIALILINIITLPPEIALGVMVIAAAPGGVTSNVLTKFAGGDVALSVSLTAIISLLCVITIPIVILLSSYFLPVSSNISISILDIAIKMFLIVTVPVLIGIFFRKYYANFSSSFEPYAKKISTLLLSICVLYIPI